MRRLVLAIVLALASCGDGRAPAPPPDEPAGDGGGEAGGGEGAGDPGDGGDAPSDPGDAGGGTDAGDGGGDAGGDAAPGGGADAGGGGGDADPGGGGDAGGGTGDEQDEGGDSGAGDGGAEGGGAPPGPVTSPDGTVVVERLDMHAECDGLVPAHAPDAVSASLPDAPSCGSGGISEGGGHVAVPARLGAGWSQWQVFTSGGRPAGSFGLSAYGVLPQPDGWAGARAGARIAPYGSVEALSLYPDGTPRASERVERATDSPIHQWGTAEDPLGGMLLFHSWHDMDGSGRCGGDARRLDAQGRPRGPPGEIGCATVAAGVSNRGEALVLEESSEGDVYVRWLRPDGTPARPRTLEGEKQDLFVGYDTRLVPLLDGSLAVMDRYVWTRRYPHLGDRSEPAPAWLASLGRDRFRFTRGNRGYAVFHVAAGLGGDPPSADCSQRVELRAPSGRLCGTVTLRNPGAACHPGAADQGWDGTVVEQDVRERCAWRWWPGLLGE